MLPVRDVFRFLWSRRSFRFMVLGAALHSFVGYGVGYWIPAFLIRSHHLGTGLIGQLLFYLGFAGLLGTFLGGYLGDRFALRDQRWYVWLPAVATISAIPFSLFFYLSDINLIGMGLGPQLTGILSDVLNKHTTLGAESLRWALVCVLMVNVGAALCYFIASKDLREDLAKPKDG